MLIAAYLAAVVAANLSVTFFGPASAPVNALLFIGLDLTARDRLHAAWAGRGLKWKMGLLILLGSLLSALLNPASARVSAASAVAFLAAGATDSLVYHRTGSVRRSNLAGAAVDSLLFAPLAFGGVLPLVCAGQFGAKVLGGELWARVLRHG